MKRFAYTNLRLGIGLVIPPLVGLLLFTIGNPRQVFGSTLLEFAVIFLGAYFYLGLQSIIYTLFMEGVGRLLLYRLNGRGFALGLVLTGGVLGTLIAASLNFMETSALPEYRIVVNGAVLIGIIPVSLLFPLWQLARRYRAKQKAAEAAGSFAS